MQKTCIIHAFAIRQRKDVGRRFWRQIVKSIQQMPSASFLYKIRNNKKKKDAIYDKLHPIELWQISRFEVE